MKRSLLIIGLIGLTSVGAIAQKQVGEFLQAGLDDGRKLSHAYLRPYGEMLGSSLNSGWYTSAAPHHILGFEVTLMGSYVMVPSAGESFDINSLGLEDFKVSSTSPGSIAPTMSGKFNSNQLPLLEPNVTGGEYAAFSVPNGSGANYMVSPMLQAAVGIPFESEVIVRYLPERNLGDFGKVGLWGLGFKHSLKDYIPFLKRVPFWNMSVLGAYTNFRSAMGLPDNDVLDQGDMDISSSAFTGRLLIGANLPVISFFSGVGYGMATSNYDISGAMNGDPATKLLALEYKTDGFDFNVGTRIRLGIFAVSADYTVGDYNMVNVGLGVNFR